MQFVDYVTIDCFPQQRVSQSDLKRTPQKKEARSERTRCIPGTLEHEEETTNTSRHERFQEICQDESSAQVFKSENYQHLEEDVICQDSDPPEAAQL